MSFLDDYEPVEVRIDKFYADHPDGHIITELVSYDGSQWVFKASVYRGGELHGEVAATGFAHEVTTARGVNSTSACENCETSAIGRALANLNYAAKGKRPSREEMTKAAPEPAPKYVVNYVTAWVTSSGMAEWVKEQHYAWPWTQATCDAIAHHIEAAAGPGVEKGSETPSDIPPSGASARDGVPAAAPFLAGEATLNLLRSRVSALVGDKVAVSKHREAHGLPSLDTPGITDAQADAWKKMLDDIETGLTRPFV